MRSSRIPSQLLRASLMLTGAAATYLVMAACSGGGGGSDTSSDASGPGVLNPVPPANAEPSKSGSRLKARYEVGADSSRQFVGWRDTKLGIDCAFQWTTETKRRCLPPRQGAPQDILYATLAECQANLGQTVHTGAIPGIIAECGASEEGKYLTVVTPKVAGACGDLPAVSKAFRLTALVPPRTTYILYSCEQRTVTDLYSYEDVSLGEFVESTQEIDP